jgi:hypothetical protein
MPEPATLDTPIEIPDSLMGAAPEGDTKPAEGSVQEPAAPDDGPADIMDFEFDVFSPDGGEPEPEPKPKPKPEAKKPDPEPELEPEPKPEAKKGEPEGEPAGGEPKENKSPSDLREQVVAANERAREAQARYEEQQGELERIRKEREELDQRLKSTTDAITRADARNHPQVTAIWSPFEQQLERFAEDMDSSGAEADTLRRLHPQLIEERIAMGRPGSEGFEERRQKFIDHVGELFPENRKQIAALITEGARTKTQVDQKINEITADAERYHYDAQVQNHMNAVKRYEEVEKTFGVIPAELRETNPNDPRILLEKLMEEVPQLKERAALTKQYLRRVSLPLAPVDPKAVQAMSEDDQVLYMQDRLKRYEQERMNHAAESYYGLMWRQAGPMLMQLITDMKDRASNAARSTPAPRENAADQTETPEEKNLSPADFEIDPNPGGI